ncbi:MAG: tetratricopeptide repeat protein [Pseudomonadota bacterium]
MKHIETIIRNLPLMLLLMLCASFARADFAAIDDALSDGEEAQAQALLDALGENANDPEAKLRQGRLYVQTNEFEKAYELLDEVTESMPTNADAFYWYGAAAGSLAANVSMFKAGKYARVVRDAFSKAIELEPQHSDAHQGLIQFHLQAPRIVGGKKKEAERLAEALRKFDPLNGALSLANVYRQTRREDDAKALLRALADEQPDEPRAWVQLGFDAQGDEDWESAHAAFSKATRAGDDREVHRNARLGALYQVGRTAVFSNTNQESGIDALREYLEADLAADLPGKDWANYRLGLLLEATDQATEAQAAFAAAKSLTDDDDLLTQLARKM